ncbi:MAG: hypothetical protein JJ896_02825 [Rhodothermales bacterium]|nr:hypothetical protein [Rhodothermales bacterium]MBO6778565.1 hypothetical protein [Rhodothermales bacterium]
MHRSIPCLLVAAVLAGPALAQTQGSRNVTLDSHLPLRAQGAAVAATFGAPDRLLYVAHERAVSLIDIESRQSVLHWSVPAQVSGLAASPSLVAVATDAGLHFFDNSGAAMDTAALGEVRDVAAYRHSNGSVYFLAATASHIVMLAGPEKEVGRVAVPTDVPNRDNGFHGVYAAYDLGTESDRLYAAGGGGYFVFDVTNPMEPALLTWVNSAAVQVGVGIQATPDASHLVTSTGYRSAPIRIFDIRPALDGTISQVRTAAGAWTADWRSHAEQFEVRWPYVFVAAQDQGMAVFNMRNAFEPYTTAWFRTPAAVDVAVRNSDGLVAVVDAETGLWLVRVEDFRGWDGRGWGVGNISSVQDWINGPVGADRWQP